jgi:hypothetical protein
LDSAQVNATPVTMAVEISMVTVKTKVTAAAKRGPAMRARAVHAVSAPYPNILQIDDFLVVGRSHAIGAPSSMEPLLVLKGEGATHYGTVLFQQIWDTAKPFTFSRTEPALRGAELAEACFSDKGGRARFADEVARARAVYADDPPRL